MNEKSKIFQVIKRKLVSHRQLLSQIDGRVPGSQTILNFIRTCTTNYQLTTSSFSVSSVSAGSR